MDVWIFLETKLEGDEDTLVSAIKWLLTEKILPKKKNVYGADIIIRDWLGEYADAIFGSNWKEINQIEGTIKFTICALKMLKLGKREVKFVAELVDIPKGRVYYEGVKITLHEPINKTYLIKGLLPDEFRLYKTEPGVSQPFKLMRG